MNRRFLLVAILLAGLSAALVYAKISSSGETGTTTSSPGSTAVVVATTAIRQRTVITPEMLELKSVPTDNVIPGAFSDIGVVVGQITKYPIEANSQVVPSMVVNTEIPTAVNQLSLVVPNGKRAMSIQASQVLNAGGLILPGDYVDILWNCCEGNEVVVLTLLRNVQVAAVAQSIVNAGPVDDGDTEPVAGDPGAPQPDAATVTLLLTPEEAQRIFLAEQNGGFRVDLRGVGDQELPDTPPVSILEIVPLDVINTLPETLRPDGFRNPQQ
jgi:pilus assembly protein CpaB